MAVAEKRPLDESVYSTKHIVIDIEGTTTSISFVKDTLFPYVRKNLDSYLNLHWDEEEFKDVLALLKDQAAEDTKASMDGAVEIPSGDSVEVKAAVLKNVLWQMDADRKTTALKKLQGHMWRQGYKKGELIGHLFADVAPALRDWVKDGKKLYIYSSGSVEAQKLLFGHTADGDLTELFTDFFDTEVGSKVDADSYKSIVKKLNCNPDDVLFLTDVPKEASAAREAGLPAILVEREGNEPLATELRREFSAVSSFREVEFETNIKKQKVNPEDDVEQLQKNGHSNGESAETMEVDPVKENIQAESKETKKSEIKVDAMDVVENKKAETEQEEEASNNKVEEEKLVAAEDVKSNEKCDMKSKSDENCEKGRIEAKSDEKRISRETESERKVKSDDLPEQLDTNDKEHPEAEKELKSEIVTNEVTNKEVAAKILESTSEPTDKTLEETDKTSELKTENDIVIPVQETEKMETNTEKPQPKDEVKTEGDCEKVSALEEGKTKLTMSETCDKEEMKEVKDCIKDKIVDLAENKETEEIQIKEADEIPKTDETKLEISKSEDEACEKEATELQQSKNKNLIDEPESKLKEATMKDDAVGTESVKDKNGGNEGALVKEDQNITKDEMDESKEKHNGVTNGTSGIDIKKTSDTNGSVENGHGKVDKSDIPEVIEAKNTSQIEKKVVGVDADVVVEA